MRVVIAPYYQFPVVLRSDNAREFIQGAVAYVNSRLEIAHLTGAAYHPQAQGTVGRTHRKINELVRLLDCQGKTFALNLKN